ncbi:MAG: ribonuclease HI, partial [Merismopedia sp. SIO2A8]|nr:ribonuclease HI [Merismopedia sp. SIO2A8]
MATPPIVKALYTDGACSGNPGPGGWGAIAYLSDGRVHEMGGFIPETTNNRMELQAAIEILQWFRSSPQTVSPALYTDSKYVQDGITKWIKGWKKKHWKTSAGKAVLNQDLWQELDAVTQAVNAQLDMPIQWRYVKGHAGNEGNERCDAIAHGFSQGKTPALSTVMPWDNATNTLVVESVPVTLE